MSNFICDKCGKEITEDAQGKYVTECEHYPMELQATGEAHSLETLADVIDASGEPTEPPPQAGQKK